MPCTADAACSASPDRPSPASAAWSRAHPESAPKSFAASSANGPTSRAPLESLTSLPRRSCRLRRRLGEADLQLALVHPRAGHALPRHA